MVGSAHRKLRKVLVRKGLLEDREFSIGFGDGDLDPADVIGQLFSSSIVEVPSQSSSKIDATVLPPTSITLSSHTITSTFTSTSASVAKTSFTTTSSTSQLIPSVASASTSNTNVIPSSTADSSKSSSTTSSGNIIGIVAAVIIAVLSLSVFGFFILRQRRKNRNAKLIPQVDPFRLGLSEKELPPHPTTEQRMTFGAFYGRPGPGNNPYVPASGRSITAAFGDSDSFPIPSGVAPPAISPFVDPVVNPSPNIQIPLSAAVKHTPSYTATIHGSQIPTSAYSPVTRRSYGSQSPSFVASAPPASDRHPPSEPGEQMRPGTIYHDEDVYGGI
ncbi:hypothetical protein LENED_006525 [Lentinula edodes]|uniref:Uncharacterized protein n=1 Tax=Lentinula edodes TaxID=5353 RepID=A0A1Q3EBY9_LENED|nr:hypothetical protein LENED_006525 [Lentinula edodes]